MSRRPYPGEFDREKHMLWLRFCAEARDRWGKDFKDPLPDRISFGLALMPGPATARPGTTQEAGARVVPAAGTDLDAVTVRIDDCPFCRRAHELLIDCSADPGARRVAPCGLGWLLPVYDRAARPQLVTPEQRRFDQAHRPKRY